MNIAVVTGEHGFQEREFDAVFESMEGIQFVRQELDVFVNDAGQAEYDTVVLYNFHRPYPTAAQAKTILGLTERGQGLVILHHAILAFPDWDAYSEICGIVDRRFGYHPRQTLQVQLSDATHPITAGMTPWEMGDETYTMESANEGSQPLLTVAHPNSMNVIGWTRSYQNSRVFCLQSGHDNVTFSNPNFREVLKRGIQWTGKTDS